MLLHCFRPDPVIIFETYILIKDSLKFGGGI